MKSETNSHTYGSYLKEFRLNQSLALETIAEQTKIAVHCLRAIEDGDNDRLPPEAYVKSFLRTYADMVGADADVAISLYRSDLEQRAEFKKQLLKRQAKLSIIRRIAVAAGLIAVILLLVRTSAILLEPAPVLTPAETGHNVIPKTATLDKKGFTDPWSAEDSPEQLKLKVIAVKRTWLKVIIDSQNARSYDLKPEDRLELEGTKSFNLMIGDATGLEILLNDRPVNIFGNSGQVISLKIP